MDGKNGCICAGCSDGSGIPVGLCMLLRLWFLTINPYMVDNYIDIVFYTMYVLISPYLHCTFPR